MRLVVMRGTPSLHDSGLDPNSHKNPTGKPRQMIFAATTGLPALSRSKSICQPLGLVNFDLSADCITLHPVLI